MKKTLIRKYANLIARVGANIQKGQQVNINASVDQGDFVTILVEECYKAGASQVTIDWHCQKITKLDYRYRTLKSLSTVHDWQIEKLKQRVKDIPCQIHILSDNPDGLKGINQEKVQKARKITYPITKVYKDQLENKEQWTIASVPSYEWAKKVFPNETKNKAYEMLWQEILKAVRITETNDAILEWKKHNENFKARCNWLNNHHFDYLTYESSNGTNFKVELIEKSHWCGGGETAIGGSYFNPNMPTEEVFTTPKKGKAEGKLVATKPLSYQGNIINNFYIIFKDGKAVEWNAEVGKDVLDKMLTMDEGAGYLGEVALVPVDSPISNSGILFYETLFDENASCHFAVGRGYCDCIDDYQNKTLEECQALGVNDSMIHVDFMVGNADMTITGYKDGKPTIIFKNGNWAEKI